MKVFALLLCLCALLLIDSNRRLVVTEYTISADTLPAAFDGFRIVQLSDLHGEEYGALAEKVAKLQPDMIALTGDYLNSPADLPVTAALVPRLSEIAPVYYTSGNHDWASGAIEQLRETVAAGGGVYLSNEALTLTKDGQSILLVGVEDPNGRADMVKPDALLESLAAEHPGMYTILLAHRNDFVDKYPDLECDLIFTGHGHGGVIRLPGIGGLIGTERCLFPDYDAGVFPSGRYQMVVSRGLGDAPLLPRFLNNPEIVCVTLQQ